MSLWRGRGSLRLSVFVQGMLPNNKRGEPTAQWFILPVAQRNLISRVGTS